MDRSWRYVRFMDDGDDVARLAARGGWELADPRELARENPENFHLPSAAHLDQLKPGARAKLMFKLLTLADRASAGFDVIDARELSRRNPLAWKHLGLPPGWTFEFVDGERDVYWDPQLLEDELSAAG